MSDKIKIALYLNIYFKAKSSNRISFSHSLSSHSEKLLLKNEKNNFRQK